MKIFLSSLIAFMATSLSGCMSSSGFFPPEDTLRLAQIIQYASREEIVTDNKWPDILKRRGIDLKDLGDKSMAMARMHCCGGPNESSDAALIYIPNDISTNLGDVVEIRTKGSVDKHTYMHVVTQVRDKEDGAKCHWLPDNPKLWRRVLYCEDLDKEGWEQQSGLANFWTKKPITK